MQARPTASESPILWSVTATLVLLLALLWIVPFSGASPGTALQLEEPEPALAAEITVVGPKSQAVGEIVEVAKDP